MSRYFVYELWNPVTSSPFYVGKSCKRRGSRLSEHLAEARRTIEKRHGATFKTKTILKILRQGYKIDYREVFSTNDELEALEYEKMLVEKYGRINTGTGILTNLTDGGEGMTGYVTPQWLCNMRRGPGNGMYGKNHTEYTRSLISETRKAKMDSGDIKPTIHTQAHREKLKIDNPGGKSRSKAIYAVDTSGEIAGVFSSASEASRKFGYASNFSIIEKATKKKHHKCAGYFWRYVDEYSRDEDFKKLDVAINCKKPVYQHNLDGSSVRWQSVTLACDALGINRQSVYTSINQGYRYKGIRWSYNPDS